ncbi:E3 ubiquitin-protein ligase Iruka isoform X2 [Zerene cesonia]|uniref:E3 ubiquitin-protein ligase Iruka isoform X2 n=1 Tax=Zerene cesonia TaxID=33412 RepID=UPI0018E53DE4|nr:E3 ubiquitin-protein ligase Iruka isoform X2 [Zerene cesonia]
MADAIVDSRTGDRFYCHRCNIEFEDVLQDYTCPYCASGFIEQLEGQADTQLGAGQAFHDAGMSPLDALTNRVDTAFLESFSDQAMFPLNNIPPVLRDIAFLMSGGRLRSGGGRQGVAAPPLVLVGAPGDYVFGGEALDAVVTQLLGQLEHSGPPPMPRDILNSIPNETVTEQQAEANISCSVCWENFQLGETISRLECEHIFHSSCITPWLQLHATCPICRRSLLPRDEPHAASDASGAAAPAANGDTRPRPTLTPRVVIRRSTHPLFRRGFQTHTWDSPQDMSTSSDSSTSVTTGGMWAPSTRTDSGSNSSTSVNDRTQNYHTDFDCD